MALLEEWQALMAGDDLPDLTSLLNRPAWHADAACREHPELTWFPARGESVNAAKAVCAGAWCATSAGRSSTVYPTSSASGQGPAPANGGASAGRLPDLRECAPVVDHPPEVVDGHGVAVADVAVRQLVQRSERPTDLHDAEPRLDRVLEIA